VWNFDAVSTWRAAFTSKAWEDNIKMDLGKTYCEDDGLGSGSCLGIDSVGASGAAAVVRTELFYVRSAALSTVNIKTTVYWYVPPCSLVDRYQRFE
jgi:hypothetical protein